ncbi:MAG: HAMP domain-containing protein [Deltaproteobacteria bacterium]|nr:HAMP domain-containing protein [Deltaproteobacteria bacterium]
MKFTLGIRSQLGAGIILTTLAGIGLIGLLSVKIVEMRSVNWKISEAENTVRFVRFIFARFPAAGQTKEDALRKAALAAEALKQAGINAFRFTDASGRELLNEGFSVKKAEPFQRVQPFQTDAAEQLFFSQGVKIRRIGGGWFSGGAGEALRVTASLDTFSQKNGNVDFDVPLADVNQDLALVKRFVIAYALLDSVIIIAIGFYFLSKAIINPIKKLDDAATRIAGGALGERVEPFQRADVAVENEVGSLAASFNRMAGRVETEIKRLERANLDLVNAEDELLRSRTLAAMGSLSAGIAHEIGNPLGALRGYLDILEKGGADKDGAEPPQGERDIIRRMITEAGRIDSIVREFLELARPSAKAAAAVDVNALLNDTVAGLEMHKAFKAVKVDMILQGGMPPVFIDEGKLRQVFINLLLNAAQAMSGMGSSAGITVETGVEPPQGVQKEPVDSARLQRRITDTPSGREADGAFARVEPSQREFVFIRFTDHGPGISEGDAEKIFNPFFTTKDVGKGTGLGLFVSQGIIKTYGGEITFKTAMGEGTVFTVRLPSWSA